MSLSIELRSTCQRRLPTYPIGKPQCASVTPHDAPERVCPGLRPHCLAASIVAQPGQITACPSVVMPCRYRTILRNTRHSRSGSHFPQGSGVAMPVPSTISVCRHDAPNARQSNRSARGGSFSSGAFVEGAIPMASGRMGNCLRGSGAFIGFVARVRGVHALQCHPEPYASSSAAQSSGSSKYSMIRATAGVDYV